MTTTRRPLARPLKPSEAAVVKYARLLNDGWDRDAVIRASLDRLTKTGTTQAITRLRNLGVIEEVPSAYTASGWGFRLI